MTARVEIEGLREFQRELRKVDRRFSNEFRTINRRVSDLVAGKAKRAAMAGGKQAAAAAGAIKARSTNRSAFIETVRRPPFALGVFWGMKRRSGWFSAARYAGSEGRQFDPWVGNQWDPGETGGKPYFIGAAINSSLDEVDDIYIRGIDEVASRAFPR